MEKQQKIALLSLGDVAWDVMIRTNSKLLPGGDIFGEVLNAPGGSAANTAVWAQRCGLPTSFIGKVGKDRFGRMAEETLEWEGVDTHLIKTEQHRTAAVAVWIDETGQRSMVSGRGADFYLLYSELPQDVLNATAHLHLTAWSLFTDPPRRAITKAANEVKQRGGTISLDPSSFQLIDEIGVERCIAWMQALQPDIIFPNYQEGKVLSGEKEPAIIIEKLATLFPDCLIALKLDADGALIKDGDHLCQVPSKRVSVIDATGAGDSFAGAFLSRYLQGVDVEAAAKFAVEIAAWVVSHVGARSQPDMRLKKRMNIL